MAKTKKFDGKTYTFKRTVYGRADARDATSNLIRKGFYVRVTETPSNTSQGYIFKIWVRKKKKHERKPSNKTRKFNGKFL